MQMVKLVGDYTGAEADNLRKIIGKKMFDKMIHEEAKFILKASAKVGPVVAAQL